MFTKELPGAIEGDKLFALQKMWIAFRIEMVQ
jgi:hypothetical protein